jgi:hypothetical protein
MILRRSCAVSAALLALFFVRRARATDPFEIQVYDGTANAPGEPGLELHLNHVFAGLKTADAPELPQNHQSHMTLEPSLGLLPFWELGGYFQTALRADGTFDYAGVKLRNKFVTPEGWHPHARLGVNLEVSLLPEHYDRSRWGGEIRPIAAWEDERWLFAVNPIVDLSFASPGASDGPSFEPALMAKVKVGGKVAFGVEYYASFGPIAKPDVWSAQEHYVYEAFDLLAVPHFELNAGVGEGLTSGSNGFVAKLILGYTWERAPAPPAAGGLIPRRARF